MTETYYNLGQDNMRQHYCGTSNGLIAEARTQISEEIGIPCDRIRITNKHKRSIILHDTSPHPPHPGLYLNDYGFGTLHEWKMLHVQILLPDEAKRFHAGLKAEHDSNDKATLMRLQESLELKSLELKKYRIGEREELKEYLEAKFKLNLDLGDGNSSSSSVSASGSVRNENKIDPSLSVDALGEADNANTCSTQSEADEMATTSTNAKSAKMRCTCQ